MPFVAKFWGFSMWLSGYNVERLIEMLSKDENMDPEKRDKTTEYITAQMSRHIGYQRALGRTVCTASSLWFISGKCNNKETRWYFCQQNDKSHALHVSNGHKSFISTFYIIHLHAPLTCEQLVIGSFGFPHRVWRRNVTSFCLIWHHAVRWSSVVRKKTEKWTLEACL